MASQRGDTSTAASRFREAIELDAGLAAAHFALATVEYGRERYAESLAALDQGLALEPASAKGLRLRFLIHDAQADLEAAAAAIDAYAAVDAGAAADLLYKRAELDFRAGETDLARTALVRVLELEPDHAPAHRILGLVLLTSDIALAKTHLRRFLELAPDDPEAATVEEILGSLD